MTSVTEIAEKLTADQIDRVLALLRVAGDADGANPVSEHAVLQLKDGQPALHVLVMAGDELAGYANVDVSDPAGGPGAELVVHPMLRRRGYGRQLAEAVARIAEERDADGRLRVWAHGDHPAASLIALRLGFERHRSLWQMRRSLRRPIPQPELPGDVTIRPFEPGRDEDAWLRVNARAFADHPEQGKLTRRDLDLRISAAWFDPAGFLLAERDGVLVGFHWTKVHPDGVGEVYVLGVDPELGAGLGLGTSLTLAGLHHLREQGIDEVNLYVDEGNPRAVSLYSRLGFMRWTADIGFQRITKR
ncbi:mycothiol synthase [Longispora albida]|uniref:mycothiol synthase n=1 Tax=Longispora albida TaxID=203523 RepID=UPI00035E3349|nr:mycothiol synthase [Longispora albida]